MPLCPALAAALAAQRAHYNRSVAVAQQMQPGFDTVALGQWIEGGLDALAMAMATEPAEVLQRVVDAGFEQGLRRRGGPGGPNRLWQTLAVPLAPHLAATPQRVLQAIERAAAQVAGHAGVEYESWLCSFAVLAGGLRDFEPVQQLGLLLAWRYGMAAYRPAALEAAAALPAALAREALALPAADHAEDWPGLLQALREDPWYGVDATRGRGVWIGGFTGFGGQFASPPLLRHRDELLICRSSSGTVAVMVDAWGSQCLPVAAELFDQASDAAPVAAATQMVTTRHGKASVGLPVEGLLVATTAHSLAFASPYSHRVQVFAR